MHKGAMLIKVIQAVLCLLLINTTGAFAEIPVSEIRVLNSVNVLAFPVTTTLTEVNFFPNNLHLRFTKQGQWPSVDIGGADQEATLWVVARINGEWVGAGMERLRPAQVDKPQSATPHTWITEWIEGRDFGPFNGYVFRSGESIGLFVVAGNSRLAAEFLVKERSDIVELAFPADGDILWREGDFDPIDPAPIDPAPDPDPPVVQPPITNPPPVEEPPIVVPPVVDDPIPTPKTPSWWTYLVAAFLTLIYVLGNK